jgi:hypothetical protein
MTGPIAKHGVGAHAFEETDNAAVLAPLYNCPTGQAIVAFALIGNRPGSDSTKTRGSRAFVASLLLVSLLHLPAQVAPCRYLDGPAGRGVRASVGAQPLTHVPGYSLVALIVERTPAAA